MKPSEYKHVATQRVLLVGLTGSGKSTLAAKLAEDGFNLIWLNVENAAESLMKLSPEAQDRINLINIPDSASYPIATETCMTIFKQGFASVCDEHGKVGCAACKKAGAAFSEVDLRNLTTKDIVVLDSASQLSASILAYATKGKPVDYKPERDDWGALRKYTEFFKSQFQGAQYNLIVICQAVTAELENGAEKLVPNFGSKGMSANFGSAFDHVIYMDIKNGRHKAFSKSTALPTVLTRSRSDFDISELEVPSLLPLFSPNPGTTPAPTPQKTGTEQSATVQSAHVNTQGTKAVSNLADLAAKLKGNKS